MLAAYASRRAARQATMQSCARSAAIGRRSMPHHATAARAAAGAAAHRAARPSQSCLSVGHTPQGGASSSWRGWRQVARARAAAARRLQHNHKHNHMTRCPLANHASTCESRTDRTASRRHADVVSLAAGPSGHRGDQWATINRRNPTGPPARYLRHSGRRRIRQTCRPDERPRRRRRPNGLGRARSTRAPVIVMMSLS